MPPPRAFPGRGPAPGPTVVAKGATGNPGNSLDTMALMFYRLSFGDGATPVTDLGLGAAVSVVLFTIVLIGSRFGANYLRRREVHE